MVLLLRQNWLRVSRVTRAPLRVCTTMPAFDALTTWVLLTEPLESAGERVSEVSDANPAAIGGGAMVAAVTSSGVVETASVRRPRCRSGLGLRSRRSWRFSRGNGGGEGTAASPRSVAGGSFLK